MNPLGPNITEYLDSPGLSNWTKAVQILQIAIGSLAVGIKSEQIRRFHIFKGVKYYIFIIEVFGPAVHILWSKLLCGMPMFSIGVSSPKVPNSCFC